MIVITVFTLSLAELYYTLIDDIALIDDIVNDDFDFEHPTNTSSLPSIAMEASFTQPLWTLLNCKQQQTGYNSNRAPII